MATTIVSGLRPLSASNDLDARSGALRRLAAARRIVVKVGTNVLTAGTEKLNLPVMAGLVDQIASARSGGREILLVSSGAVAAGRHVLATRTDSGGNSVPVKQALASVGQSRLMAAYDQFFGWHDIVVAQALLTRHDLQDRVAYLNARTTLVSLLELGVVPIVNENDVVAVDELTGLTFGDNDTLSALVANVVDADLLVILTDTPGLFTSDPGLDPSATLVPFVPHVTSSVLAMAGSSTSGRGRGGMLTKLKAAQVATTAGVTVVITSGREPNAVPRLLAGEQLGTIFSATATKLESRKRWILSGATRNGAVVVDAGARHALLDGGKSLLAAGIVKVEGSFDRGDAIDIQSLDGQALGRGISSYSADECRTIAGAQSHQIGDLLGFNFGAEIVHRNNLVLFESRSQEL